MKIFLKNKTYLLLILFISISSKAFCQLSSSDIAATLLLNRLKSEILDTSELKKNSLDSQNLLKFYRNRTSVKHRADSKVLASISKKDLKYANDALEHIFVGQPAYPAHFCGEDINWNSRPVPDKEWVWQLNRMYFWNSMKRVYASTKDERYAKAWCEQIIDWVEKNPNDKDHDYAWRSIEAGIRGYSWPGQFYQFLHSQHFTPEVLISFMNSCFEHAEYLMTTYSSGSNWALMEAEGLATIAFAFPEFKQAAKWKAEAIRRYNIEIDKQVYPDGQQHELTMGYHVGSIRWFYRTYELAMLNGEEDLFSESYIKKLEKMSEIPMKLCLPDGTNAQFGDSWAGEPGQYSQRFKEWATLYNRNDFLYLSSNGEQGEAPKKTSFALEDSGLYSMRSDWTNEAICLVLKNGPNAGYHTQPDNGTFTLYAGGRTLMPDSGSYIYSGDPKWRKWFRQTKVHQTLTLNGEDAAYKPKLIKWKSNDNLDILVIENSSYGGLKHRRSVIFIDKSYFIIVDEAIGKAIGDVAIHFQLAPGEAIYDHKKLSVQSNFKDGWNIHVKTNQQNNIDLLEEEGWVSFIYTKKETRPAFKYQIKKQKADEAIKFITVVAPYKKEIPNIKVQLVEDNKLNSNSLSLLVNENGVERVIDLE